MGKIKNYTQDSNVSEFDTLIGTDSGTNRRTKTFSLASLKAFYTGELETDLTALEVIVTSQGVTITSQGVTIDTHQSNIVDLQATSIIHTNSIDALEEEQIEQNTLISANGALSATNDGLIRNLSTTVDTNTGNIITNTTNITTNTTNITDLQTQYSGLGSVAYLDQTLQDQGVLIQTNITNISSNTGDIAAVEGRVTVLENTSYTIDSTQDGTDVDLELFKDGLSVSNITLEAGTNITLTNSGNNVRIDADNFSDNQDIVTNATNIATNVTDIATNVTNIATNVTNIATNTASIATNTTNIATNAAGIATNAANIATNVEDIERVDIGVDNNEVLINANTINIATNTADISTNVTDIVTNATNIATNVTDIATNVTNIATNTAGIATNVTDIATNTAGIATNAANIATNTADIDALQSSSVENGVGVKTLKFQVTRAELLALHETPLNILPTLPTAKMYSIESVSMVQPTGNAYYFEADTFQFWSSTVGVGRPWTTNFTQDDYDLSRNGLIVTNNASSNGKGAISMPGSALRLNTWYAVAGIEGEGDFTFWLRYRIVDVS